MKSPFTVGCFVCTRSIIMSFADDVVWTARLSSIPGVRRTCWHWHLKARRLRVWFLRDLHGLLVPLWALSRLWSVKTGTALTGNSILSIVVRVSADGCLFSLCGVVTNCWLPESNTTFTPRLLQSTPARWDPECSRSSGRTWINVNVLCKHLIVKLMRDSWWLGSSCRSRKTENAVEWDKCCGITWSWSTDYKTGT